MSGKHWTTEQKAFLIENLGILSYDAIGKRIGKTGKAVKIKRARMELGDPKEALDYVTIKFLAKIIHSSERTIKKWIKNNGLKVSYKNIATKQTISRVKLDDFWKWAKENQKLIYWEKFKVGSLGIEPKWTKEARRKYKNTRINWTTKKENLLESYIKIGFTYKQISENFNCSIDTVRSRHNLILSRIEKETQIS